MTRKGSAVWSGGLKDGHGTVSTESGVLKDVPYSFQTRFENEKNGTNPEELLGAAHAGCFSMALSNELAQEGMKPQEIRTTADVTIENFTINKIHLEVVARVPGGDNDKFQQAVARAKAGCPVSKLFHTEITASARLE